MQCRHHPDREAHVYFRGAEIWGLCFECFDARTPDSLSDLERAEILVMEYLLPALGDGVKVVYDSEKNKMSSLRLRDSTVEK